MKQIKPQDEIKLHKLETVQKLIREAEEILLDLAERSSGAEKDTYRHYSKTLREFLTHDNGQAGFDPYMQAVKLHFKVWRTK